MVQTSARLLRLLALLQSRRFWLGKELADELGVTERSVRRDVDRLRSLGYPVHAAAGVGGGYQLGAGKELPPLPLEDDEAVAVAIGLRAAAAGPVRGAEDASLRALAKLEQVLPKRLRKRVNALQEVSVRLADPGPTLDAETLTTLANACRDTELLRFEYRDQEGTPTAREVEPYRLVHTSSRWYLLAYDLVRADWRTFRVDRIVPRPVPGHAFAPRPLPSKDVAGYVARAVSARTRSFEARAIVDAPAEVVRPRLGWMGGRVEPRRDGRSSVVLQGESLEALAVWLAYVGFDFVVEHPPELADAVERLGQRLLRAVPKKRARASRGRA